MDIRIYDYDNYKKYVNDFISESPKRGRGIYSKIATHLNINTVVVSQIFKGTRDLTAEQALSLSQFFEMNYLEKEYFLYLVQIERAGNYELKNYFREKLAAIKIEASRIKNIVNNQELPEEAKFQFYSKWYYSAIRLSTLLPGCTNSQDIAKHLRLPFAQTQEVVDFLLKYGLLKQEKNQLKIGPQRTHLSEDSPYVSRHHLNWRLKGIENMEHLKHSEIFYTSPMTISQETMETIKVMILKFISEMSTHVKDAKDEKLVCLNIDFFDVD